MEIFVFGSNLAGLHFGGSAKEAMESHGAVWGQGMGIQGKSYAIPTIDEQFQKLPLSAIEANVCRFLTFALENPHLIFNIVAIGCGIAGFEPEEIALMFDNAPSNCILPPKFLKQAA